MVLSKVLKRISAAVAAVVVSAGFGVFTAGAEDFSFTEDVDTIAGYAGKTLTLTYTPDDDFEGYVALDFETPDGDVDSVIWEFDDDGVTVKDGANGEQSVTFTVPGDALPEDIETASLYIGADSGSIKVGKVTVGGGASAPADTPTTAKAETATTEPPADDGDAEAVTTAAKAADGAKLPQGDKIVPDTGIMDAIPFIGLALVAGVAVAVTRRNKK